MERTEAKPAFVELESKNDGPKKKVYVTLVSGKKSLDLYSGWDPQNSCHKNPLTALPKEVCEFSFLQRLWASHNYFTSLPPEIEQLTNLTELFLHHNRLDSIPTRLCKLSNLRLLWLNNNRISGIPYEIVQLQSLKRLHLDNNLITTFPDHLCQLTELEILYLNNNKISTISTRICDMVELSRLYMHHNQIVEIPNELCLLFKKKLKLLRLDHNQITKIPGDFNQERKKAESQKISMKFEGNPFEIRRVSPGPLMLASKDQVERRHSYDGSYPPKEALKIHRPSVPTKFNNTKVPQTESIHDKK